MNEAKSFKEYLRTEKFARVVDITLPLEELSPAYCPGVKTIIMERESELTLPAYRGRFIEEFEAKIMARDLILADFRKEDYHMVYFISEATLHKFTDEWVVRVYALGMLDNGKYKHGVTAL